MRSQAHKVTTRSWQHSTIVSISNPLFSSARIFVLTQFEDFLDKTPAGLLQVHACERQDTLAPSGLKWMHLGAAAAPWGLAWAGTANPSTQEIKKTCMPFCMENMTDLWQSYCTLLRSFVGLGAHQHWIICSFAVVNLECLILHPCFILLTYAVQNPVKSTAVWVSRY